MINWYRERARQERTMARHAHGQSARRSHVAMLRLLLKQCATQPALDRGICAHCSMRATCRKLLTRQIPDRLAA